MTQQRLSKSQRLIMALTYALCAACLAILLASLEQSRSLSDLVLVWGTPLTAIGGATIGYLVAPQVGRRGLGGVARSIVAGTVGLVAGSFIAGVLFFFVSLMLNLGEVSTTLFDDLFAFPLLAVLIPMGVALNSPVFTAAILLAIGLTHLVGRRQWAA